MIKNNRYTHIIIFTFLLVIEGCISNSGKGNRTVNGQVVNNSSTVDKFHGRVLRDNPVILSGNYNLPADTKLGKYLLHAQDYITSNNTLVGSCQGITDINNPCYRVYQDQYSPPLISGDFKWAFPAETLEFNQVHTFYHMGKLIETFQANLNTYYKLLHLDSYGNQKTPSYSTSIPYSLYTELGHWGTLTTLQGYSNSDVEDNASFSPSDFSIHMGYLTKYPQVKLVHDPSIIYHETGHAVINVLLNLRNTAHGNNPDPLYESEMGYLQYDEGGAINEGLADYFAYTINKRNEFSEWALGLVSLSRPLSENSFLHIPGISTDPAERLSYPAYLTYEPNKPGVVFEEIHVSSMIITHYLVALTEDFMNKCYLSQPNAISYVHNVISETLAELGDLTSTGNSDPVFTVNLTSTYSHDFARVDGSINYFNFSQTLARKLLTMYASGNRCNGYNYSKDNIETLLDAYGLLLFSTYNDDGGNAITGHLGTKTSITPSNRLKSVTIPKSKINLVSGDGLVSGFIFDDRTEMQNALKNLTGSLQVTEVSPYIKSNLPRNNGNGKVSPGELVGIAFNLFNSSNTDMGGIQLLANDWDHMKNDKPCNTFEDNFPQSAEGAADSSTEANPSSVPGDCNYVTRTLGNEANEDLYPVCMVEIGDDDATKWASQEKLRQKLGLEPHLCLSGDATKTRDCFVRVLKGADHTWFAKINANKSWEDSAPLSKDGSTPEFNYSNIIFFEVSEHIHPGTTFNCRMRVRFSNCSDCFTDTARSDLDNYLDYEYTGNRPYKIINFQFVVTD